MPSKYERRILQPRGPSSSIGHLTRPASRFDYDTSEGVHLNDDIMVSFLRNVAQSIITMKMPRAEILYLRFHSQHREIRRDAVQLQSRRP